MKIEEFIEARIVEDEAIAKTAGGDRWDYDPSEQKANGEVYRPDSTREYTYKSSFGGPPRTSAEFAYVTCDHEGLSASVDEQEGVHIARHDPARVLRQCAALRAALWFCKGLASVSQQIEFEDDVLTPLAAMWSDHPDYDPAWAVDEGGSKA